MKALLVVTMTMLIGSSVFAAECSVSNTTGCDKDSCDKLVDGINKFQYNPLATGVTKCLVVSAGPVATDCTQGADSGRTSKAVTGGSTPTEGPGAAKPK